MRRYGFFRHQSIARSVAKPATDSRGPKALAMTSPGSDPGAPHELLAPAALTAALPTTEALHLKGLLLVLMAGLLWSTGGVLIRLLESAGLWELLLYRAIFTVLSLLLLLAWRRPGQVWRSFRAAGAVGVLAGACLAASTLCFVSALMVTTVANVLFMSAVQPFLAALLALWLLREPVSAVTWMTMALAAVGVLVIVGSGISLGRGAGNLLAFGAAATFAAFSVALRAGKSVDMLPAVCSGAGVVAAVAVVVIVVEDASFAISSRDLGLCALMGVGQIALGMVAYTAGSRYLATAELMLMSYLELVLGPVWVWLVVAEVPVAGTVIGGGIIIGAIVARTVLGVRRRPQVAVR